MAESPLSPSEIPSDLKSLIDQIKISKPQHLYNYGNKSDPGFLVRCVHNATNYDEIVKQATQASIQIDIELVKQELWKRAASLVNEHIREEYNKVIEHSTKQKKTLKDILNRFGVGTVVALTAKLDAFSDKLKDMARLENSQQSLRIWNDTYRVQREIVKEILNCNGVSSEVQQQVKAVYGTRSSNKAIEIGGSLLNYEESEILKLVKSAIRYTNTQ